MGMKIDGKKIATTHRENIRAKIDEKTSIGVRNPSMVAVLVGNDGGSISYMKNQQKLSETLGVKYNSLILDETITQEELIDKIRELNDDNTVDGIILQLPLPKNFNEKEVTSAICANKDIDGLTDINTGRLYKGEKCFIPCTAKSIIELIKYIENDIKGKNAVVIGRSNIVGKPVAQLLLNENATVTICHSKTKDLKEVCKRADILVAAIGKPGFVTKDFVKEGAIVIDVGTTMVDGKIKGDVLYDEVIEVASHVSPVPGGVGAMTTTMLLKNTCEAWNKNV
ncbi:MAG: bifunctional methylenetetrahydrofolate dehydrogenase/methenyltetrahydrofolate cyclohydrolase [Clostridium argentinense]|uniref:Bifunctional protein FolD n=1 Tax=Clostridium faecium TaxID=2762223 RepID=A0ABR8YVU1_9CLOT|nr:MULTISPECIES: tetrahydrofolate dehydrogenase/cyclohydrolase catalytic domain-containing protein [Clostridium]MBD8048392.1 bifunctional methylenetetrahydrofolate dehydrogenase/methenyltetrahydrofolate cyclohydrolase [Clostridium faecium]MBS5823231.1 bifunctional methylenetetrahydrofolate dehydrogenase/methenyltetrahydrofolate cyclohydrolase [Clostridium argentinense]MDU1349025.1 tetrahydrofolate dehydrogenase/cyclohydrolase catalytic domain-containing protein [Clostridium argentinense]